MLADDLCRSSSLASASPVAGGVWLGVARDIAGILGTTYASLGPVIMGAIGPAGLFYINASILLMGCGTCLLIARDTTGVTLR